MKKTKNNFGYSSLASLQTVAMEFTSLMTSIKLDSTCRNFVCMLRIGEVKAEIGIA